MSAPTLAAAAAVGATELIGALPGRTELNRAAPIPPAVAAGIRAGRTEVADVFTGVDRRLMVIVGPCSIHDPDAGLEYATRLARQAARLGDDLLVVMRCYLEKPRSVVGWRGLVLDPDLDGTADLARGLVVARRFLAGVAGLGLPVATEFLDPLLAPLLAEAVSWGCIGARTTHSQTHRVLAAGLPMPVGFKNAPDGDVGAAVDAIRAARAPHVHPALDDEGRAVIVRAPGNPLTHPVLRGGTAGTNHDPAAVAAALAALRAAGLPAAVVVDASHANSGKDHRRQPAVAADLAAQVAEGNTGLVGVMLESFLEPGRQDRPHRYGQSITDACLGWDGTVGVLEELALAARARRARQ
ncbi:phospho-2-dehydro-3-deoxyheptonate aldolase [Pilimelia anulata]|uniref:Phospho-2-dehydro-3-deoxyheptonate aldolase n=1 Tax=Pilimelia anulata TaxID=53371 RepID=A0A8J3BCI9_9ACTN|nr:3-deoxy-7-phosphoheptulonate synthase [Pilimelia anulata]GGK04105.1 phospho-2-dehydro-3-deoxyheptonate aldolase [Pilimelia anulata]